MCRDQDGGGARQLGNDLSKEFYPTAVQEAPPSVATVDVPALLTETGFAEQDQWDFHLPVPIAGPAAFWELFATRLPIADSRGRWTGYPATAPRSSATASWPAPS